MTPLDTAGFGNLVGKPAAADSSSDKKQDEEEDTPPQPEKVIFVTCRPAASLLGSKRSKKNTGKI